MWYVQTMEYYSAMKWNDILSLTTCLLSYSIWDILVGKLRSTVYVRTMVLKMQASEPPLWASGFQNPGFPFRPSKI
jgi:hypothetical protein